MNRKAVRVTTSLALTGATVLFAVASVATVASASTKKKKVSAPTFKVETPPSASVTETGSTLLYPLWNIWAPAYTHQFSQVNLTTGGTGSGTGIADAASGTVNIGSSDAYLSPSVLSATPSLMNIPLAISYQVIAYNIPGLHAHLKLNGKILSAIYRGVITNWNDPAITALNPGVTLPDLKIVALHRSDGSGDTFLFTQYLSRQDATWNSSIAYGTTVSWPSIPNALGENGNGGMVSGCGATPGCVAYVGVSFLSQVLGGGMAYASLLNGTGTYVLPSQATAATEAAGYAKITPKNGTISMINGRVKGGYPIINYEYAIVNKSQSSSSTAKAVRSLLEWAINPKLGNSTRFLAQVNFLPLPTKVAVASLKQIQQIQ
ncbi:MAG: phosphate ABC transporter substrate-binding protein PstS [Acidobacteriota bacterium]|nr:phosphate ABC transporter substrate-binding protein PstS [Acidobacteriota bacterium]MDE3044039.1 phosphate ABC transporter substrate-binding protein PstS [Acidobacteriota bacterium]MDE3223399.1 phosphate ABC transporter substrate-binding protein PstS [Acidobacteriota bacterium]